jgi:HlyD family secretion protein
MKKRAFLIVTVVAAVTASAAAYYRASQAGEPPSLMTATVARGDVVETIDATGTLEAVTTVQVGTQVSGVIQALFADFNSYVRKGEVIAQLDRSLFQTQVDQADATVARLEAEVDRAGVQLSDARLKLERARRLLEQQLIPAIELETAESNLRMAESALKAAEAQVVQARASLNQSRVSLNHTTITAPIDGVVISRNVDVGQTVAASMSAPTLFVIARDLTEMQVNARIDESDIGRVRSGQAVTFRVDAYPDDTFRGVVSQVRLSPVVEQNVVSYVTVIDVPNPEGRLKPGMTATVRVEIARADHSLHVPFSALRFRPTPEDLGRLGNAVPAAASGRGPVVWTLQDGRLDAVRIRPGVSDGVSVALADGPLWEGAVVVTGLAASQTAPATPGAGSPLLPRFPGGNRGAGAGQRGAGAGGRS